MRGFGTRHLRTKVETASGESIKEFFLTNINFQKFLINEYLNFLPKSSTSQKDLYKQFEILKPKESIKYISFDSENTNNSTNNDSLMETSQNYPFLQHEKKLDAKKGLNHPKFTKFFKLPVDLLHNIFNYLGYSSDDYRSQALSMVCRYFALKVSRLEQIHLFRSFSTAQLVNRTVQTKI